MGRVYVSLDIETTGLDIKRDTILEVGAVRFKGDKVYETYNQMVNPGRPIPYKIQQLTGITEADVKNAPPITAILAELSRFVGENPIIGHNISFDLGFLRQQGLFQKNSGIDTFELASVLLPYAGRYSLSKLLDYLEVEIPPEAELHRALSDAILTKSLFEALLDQARRLDGRIIAEIASLIKKGAWSLAPVFYDLSRERSIAIDSNSLDLTSINSTQQRYRQPLKPVDTVEKIKVEQLCNLLEKDGLFEKNFSGFEYRPQQVDMLANVVGAFNESCHLMVEAGTGTGKSMAYLIPAIYWAMKNGQRVVISTNTINLQDQLIKKDIPTLQKILPINFKAVSLKGRSNYVCPRRVQLFRMKEKLTPKESRLLAKLLVWMPNSATGDREELFMPDYEEQALWGQVASDVNSCASDMCNAGSCFYAQARLTAESAHLIIVNHALLMADIAVDNKVIPEYNHLIIDEAHHLEDNITNQLTFTVDEKLVRQLLNELSATRRGGNLPTGFINEIFRRCIIAVPSGVKDDVTEIINKNHKAVEGLRKDSRMLFKALKMFVNEFSSRSSYNQRIRLTDDTRSKSTWSNVELTWDIIKDSLNELSTALNILSTLLIELESYDIPNWEELTTNLKYYHSRIDEIRANLQIILVEPSKETILWVEYNMRTTAVSLHNAPLHVGDLVLNHLLKPKESIIFTSATLQTNNSFDYFQERLSLWDVEKAAVGSPFDYENNTLLYIPTNMPDPKSPDYKNGIARGLIELVKEIKGRTLVLFTAYSQLRGVADSIRGPLAEADIVVYQQGDGTSRRQMLENFQSGEQAVLLGTRSFWEGIDVPGPALSCVVITRIPFAVPNDPIIAARSETFDNSFIQYSIPQAILLFRQGFGRLIRTKNDRGVVAIFDRRVINKRYGKAILNSLPCVTERRGLLANLPQMAIEWIDSGEKKQN